MNEKAIEAALEVYGNGARIGETLRHFISRVLAAAAFPPLRAREEIAREIEQAWDAATPPFRRAALVAADAILSSTAGQEWRDIIPDIFIREFMAHRHFWAAKDLDIVARKDGQEYRLEADWLKQFIRALSAQPVAENKRPIP